MGDKERLEKIKDHVIWTTEEGILPRIEDSDLQWLIEQAELREEQVQRNLQALENISVLEGIYDRLEKQNQRYEHFLAKIKNTNTSKEIYQLWAKKALEGEE